MSLGNVPPSPQLARALTPMWRLMPPERSARPNDKSAAAPEPYVRIFGEIPRALRARSAVALVIAAFKTCPLGQRGGMRIERLEDRSPRPIRARGPCTTARTRCLAARQSRPATAEGWPGSGGRARLERGPGARQPRAPPCLKPVRAASGRRRPTQSENYSTYIKASSAPAIHARAPIVNIILVLPRIHVAPNALIPRVITRRPLPRACDVDIIALMAMRPSAYVPHFLCGGCPGVVEPGIPCHRHGSCAC
jgi:hypothetical protein